jgi:hypothetical protein
MVLGSQKQNMSELLQFVRASVKLWKYSFISYMFLTRVSMQENRQKIQNNESQLF